MCSYEIDELYIIGEGKRRRRRKSRGKEIEDVSKKISPTIEANVPLSSPMMNEYPIEANQIIPQQGKFYKLQIFATPKNLFTNLK